MSTSTSLPVTSQREQAHARIVWVVIVSLLAALLGVFSAPPANAVGFTISGTIAGAGSGPLTGARACATPVAGGSGICSELSVNGSYTITDVAAGTWLIRFTPPEGSDFLGQSWNNVPIPAPIGSSPTPLVLSSNVGGIDATLALGTYITGALYGPDGTPLQNGTVTAYNTSDFTSTSASTATDGSYRVPGLRPGNYQIRYDPPPSIAYAPEWWNDQLTQSSATVVTLATSPVTGLSTTLAPAGGLSGNVKGVLNADLVGANIGFYTLDGALVQSVSTNASGNWSVSTLPAGTYALQFIGPFGEGYANEWWENKSSRALSNPVTVSAGSTTAGLNAVLELAGTITGNVSDTAGSDIPTVIVRAIGSDGYTSGITYTDASGNYTISGLKPGEYSVSFDPSSTIGGYAREWWNDATTLAAATYFTLAAGSTVSRNAVLAAGATISGTLTDAAGNAVGGTVWVYRADGSEANEGNFEKLFLAGRGDGTYSVTGLPVGTYRVGFTAGFWISPNIPTGLPSSDPYVSEWFSNKYSFTGATTVTLASPGDVVTGIVGTLENPRFADVPDPSSTFYPFIEWMASSNISTGTVQPTGKPLYKPADAVSRQAMALFLYRLSGETFVPTGPPSFADVTSSSHPTFYTAIEWMYARGISTGTAQPSGNPLYKPSDPVSRQSMALFIARYAGANLSTAPTTQRFADVPLNAPTAAAIDWMFLSGISTGTTQPTGLPLFKPADPVSRQAMAAFLYRLINGT